MKEFSSVPTFIPTLGNKNEPLPFVKYFCYKISFLVLFIRLLWKIMFRVF